MFFDKAYLPSQIETSIHIQFTNNPRVTIFIITYMNARRTPLLNINATRPLSRCYR